MVTKCLAHYTTRFQTRVSEEEADCGADYSEFGGPDSKEASTVIPASIEDLRLTCLEMFVGSGDRDTCRTAKCTALRNALCPGGCTGAGNGQCTNGACQCNAPWAGPGCSIYARVPPKLAALAATDRACNTRDAKHCAVQGSGFICQKQNGKNCNHPDNTLFPKCRYQVVSGATKEVADAEPVVKRGRYLGERLILCPVPDASGAKTSPRLHKGVAPLKTRVQASNDGKKWSTEDVFFYFYDGDCQVYDEKKKTAATMFTANLGTCQIDQGAPSSPPCNVREH